MSETYSIGALSTLSGVNIETIRYYERVRLMPVPARGTNGYRRYDRTSAERLEFIRRGRELGFAVDEIRRLLELTDHPESPCSGADEMVLVHLEDIEEKIRDLQRMRKALREIACCAADTAADCRLVQALSPPGPV